MPGCVGGGSSIKRQVAGLSWTRRVIVILLAIFLQKCNFSDIPLEKRLQIRHTHTLAAAGWLIAVVRELTSNLAISHLWKVVQALDCLFVSWLAVP